MPQGIFVNGRRPKSKKEVKEAIEAGKPVRLENTSLMGKGDYDGLVTEMPENQTVYIVGPCPFNDRKFYGQITRKGTKITVK